MAYTHTFELYSKLFAYYQQELVPYFLYLVLTHARFAQRIIVWLTNEKTAESEHPLAIQLYSSYITTEMTHSELAN